MFVVCVSFKLHEGQDELFMPLMRAQAENSMALEAGCHQFDVCLGADGEVFLYEIYGDAEAFDQHLESGHFKEFDLNTRDMIQSKTVKTYLLAHRGS